MARIDFNCDLGEGCSDDAAIVPWISSASIACGAHAGDDETMRATLRLCRDHGVAAGAHPGFEDRAGFGRRDGPLDAGAVHALVSRQLSRLASLASDEGVRLAHAKPHGALYNASARDRGVADAIAAAVRDFDPRLLLYGLAGSASIAAARAAGLRAVPEAFAERAYDADGSLAPRGTPGAVIDTLEGATVQVLQLVRDGSVAARCGTRIRLQADTLCLHGDRPGAARFARALRTTLEDAGIRVEAPVWTTP